MSYHVHITCELNDLTVVAGWGYWRKWLWTIADKAAKRATAVSCMKAVETFDQEPHCLTLAWQHLIVLGDFGTILQPCLCRQRQVI